VPRGPEYLRRGLLGLVTALLVARPLVLGEDPGMLQSGTNTSFLILTLFWFITGLGWAVWRYWSGKTAWHGGIVEASLLAAALLVAISTRAASYKHPALLVTWEWLALALALFLMRQLAVTESDRRHLLAAFLASAVSLAAFAIYQYNVERPQRHIAGATLIREPVPLSTVQVASQAVGFFGNSTDGPIPVLPLLYRLNLERYESTAHDTEESIARRLEEELSARGPFARSSSFASYLVLFVPALFAAVHLRYRRPEARWQPTAAALCCLVVMLALFLTHSRGAILGLGLAGLAAVGVAVRRGKIPGEAALLLAALGGVLILLLQTGALDGVVGSPTEAERHRRDYWNSTWQMIRKHPWLGVGAGNFGREYPVYTEAESYAPLTEPHNFALEMWATYGLLSLLAILAALVGMRPPGIFTSGAWRGCCWASCCSRRGILPKWCWRTRRRRATSCCGQAG
jgi:O-antigen ligase